MIQGVIMLLLAPILGVKLTIGTVATLLPIIFVLAFALSALGLLISARMNSVQGFQMVSNFMVMPMFFLSGALFPLGNLPSWLEVLTRINPVTYGGRRRASDRVGGDEQISRAERAAWANGIRSNDDSPSGHADRSRIRRGGYLAGGAGFRHPRVSLYGALGRC